MQIDSNLQLSFIYTVADQAQSNLRSLYIVCSSLVILKKQIWQLPRDRALGRETSNRIAFREGDHLLQPVGREGKAGKKIIEKQQTIPTMDRLAGPVIVDLMYRMKEDRDEKSPGYWKRRQN